MASNLNGNFAKTILDKFREINKEQESAQRTTSVPSKSFVVSQDFNKRENKNFTKFRKRPYEKTSKNETPLPSVPESEVGINQYISQHAGFSGIIKHRYSDFQVNEIDLDRNIVELTSKEIPDPKTEEENVSTEAYENVLTPTQWAKLDEIIAAETNTDMLQIEVTEKNKEERGIIHRAVKSKYGPKVISNTKAIGEEKFIVIGKKIKAEGRSEWPRSRPSYLHFTLHKVNMDITEVVHLLVDKLRVKAGIIGYAGTKDKRAKTSQRMSIKKKPAEALAAVSWKNVHIGNFEYKDEELKLGDTSGNKFRIAVRNVEAENDVIEATLNTLKENGFINYFGLQRFGFATTPTYVIGKALLSDNWEKAVELILKPRENMWKRKDLKSACEKWWETRDADPAVSLLFKHDNSIEAKILRTLKKKGNRNFMGALLSLPRTTMTLYLHSYQSIIWNKIVSKRIEKFGIKTIPGDLVLEDPSIQLDNEFEEDEELVKEEDEQDENTECNGHKAAKKRQLKVRALSSEEAEKTPLTDVVYPLPGYDIKYPENEIAQWYNDLLAEDGFTHNDLNKTHKNFSLRGAYRKLLAKAENLSWEIIYYDDLEQDIILSDIDKFEKKTLPDRIGGKYKAVLLSFHLKPCSYATMALREVMKCDTSVYHQASLTQAHFTENKKIKLNK